MLHQVNSASGLSQMEAQFLLNVRCMLHSMQATTLTLSKYCVRVYHTTSIVLLGPMQEDSGRWGRSITR